MVPLEPKSDRLAMAVAPERAKQHADAFTFSSFRLDCRTCRLTRAGTPIPLRPKSWAVLAYLLARPGHLVSTDELLDAVWPGVSVTPDTVGKSIGELRRVLGDDVKNPRFIETARRRGFRFIGDVRTDEAGGVGTEPPSLPTSTHSFVGRVAELERLSGHLARADLSEPQIVFVTGEAGIGKTELVDEFVGSTVLRPESSWVGRGTCVEQHGPSEPYLPVLDALGSLARRCDAGALPELLRRFAPTWLAQMPWLTPSDAGELRGSLGETRPERMLREFAVLLEELTQDRTLLLYLEDLQWADAATVDLLSFLGRRRQPARWVVLGTYRPADLVAFGHPLADVARGLIAHGLAAEIPVHGFTLDEIEGYLSARLPGFDVSGSLAREIHRHTDGNPLFVSATLDHMRSTGWLLETSPGWAIPEHLDLSALGVPDDARRLITDQLRALSPMERDLLAAASVVGRSFLSQTVAEASGSTPERVEECFAALSHAGRFLRAARTGPASVRPSPWGYEFVHELYRRAVYDEVAPARRVWLHRRVGDSLERSHAGRLADAPSGLARHYELGDEPLKAVTYLERAAAVAQERFAPREAIHLLEEAIALAEGIGDPSRSRSRELELRLAMAIPLGSQHGFSSDPLLRNCERTNELAAEVGSDQQRFDSAYALFHVHATRADAVDVPRTERQLEDLAKRIGSPEVRLQADSARLRAAVFLGDFEKARRLMRGALASAPLRNPSHGASHFGADPLLGARSHYALGLWFLGEIEEARQTSEACLAVAQDPAIPEFTRCLELTFASLLAVLMREPAVARKRAEEAEALGRDRGFGLWEALAAALGGWARVHTGEPEQGIEDLEQATRRLEELGMRMFSTSILAYRAEAHLKGGDLSSGLKVLEEGLRIAESTLDRMCWPELWRLKAEILFAAGSSDAAGGPESCARRALEIAERSGARSLELRAAATWVRVSRARERDEARVRLAAVCRSFARIEPTPDLLEAHALLGDGSTSDHPLP